MELVDVLILGLVIIILARLMMMEIVFIQRDVMLLVILHWN